MRLRRSVDGEVLCVIGRARLVRVAHVQGGGELLLEGVVGAHAGVRARVSLGEASLGGLEEE